MGLRSSGGQDSQGLKAEPWRGRGLGRQEGDSHEDMERPPEDGMSEEACEPHPEDVWDLEGHKGTVGWGSGWILGGRRPLPRPCPRLTSKIRMITAPMTVTSSPTSRMPSWGLT